MTASVTSLAFAGLSQKIVTRTSARAVMAFGMALIGAGMLWAAQAPPHGSFWPDLAGPFFVAGVGTAFAFIPISIGALTGVTERDAGVASGLLSTSQNLGGVIGAPGRHRLDQLLQRLRRRPAVRRVQAVRLGPRDGP